MFRVVKKAYHLLFPRVKGYTYLILLQVETLVRLVVAAILIGDVTALIIPSIFKVSCGFFKTKEDTTAKQLKNKKL